MARVTRAAAARELGVNKSTVKRWCDKHPALMDERGMVDVDELREHRDTVINPGLQTAGRAITEDPAPARVSEPGLNAHRSRREKATADSAELDLADRLGKTMRRADVESAVGEAAALLRETAAQIARDRAERLARIDDVRAMEAELEDMTRAMLAEGARFLEEAVKGESESDAA